MASATVPLSVGGELFQTTTVTLSRAGASSALASLGPSSQSDPHFLDGDPHLFAHLLSFLHHGRLLAPPPPSAALLAELELWRNTLAFVQSMAINAALDLHIADTIQQHGGVATLNQIATKAMVHPARIPCLSRLLRVLTTTGVFGTQTPPGANSELLLYTLTPTSSLLVGSRNLVPYTALMLDPGTVSSLFELGRWLQCELPEPCMFKLRNGHTFSELAQHDPSVSALFNDGMASDTEFIMDIAVKECGEVFQGIVKLLDRCRRETLVLRPMPSPRRSHM
ncbi:O-methyltransferase ZRP4 [Dichanthelium oligosanthes]|uniref:O-methyltransferase ZRP4 n=1 Tax=Dichanthelium oligosanthes TaxID=888268 RepID=A0A1E5UZC2_9POAL|nr:O-methyltransferase ZRP4 [Dichanthelium oligosanthes]